MSSYVKSMEKDTEITIDLYNLIRDLWRGTRKLSWLVVVLAIISAGCACVYKRQRFYTYYTASATFTVNISAAVKSETSIYDEVLRASQMSKTFPYIITSDVLRNDIAKELGLSYLTEPIRAETIEGTNLFAIHVTSSNPDLAYEILQSVIRNYPRIAEPVVGRTYLTMLDETGIPQEPETPWFLANSKNEKTKEKG